MQGNKLPILWYFADPMCSWCWGFSPVISQIRQTYDSRLNIALVMGGLRTDHTSAMTAQLRDEILHHWREVHKLSGQSFDFENAMPEGFIYNTEPACRAVITAGLLDSSKTFEFFTAIQQAFYTRNEDVTEPECLQQLASACGLDAAQFQQLFSNEKTRDSTVKSFEFTQKAGVRGFPTLVLQQGEQLQFLSRGYQDFSSISAALDEALENP